jgi:hypothetical protein
VNDVPIDRTIGSWINNEDAMAPVAIRSGNRGPIIATGSCQGVLAAPESGAALIAGGRCVTASALEEE